MNTEIDSKNIAGLSMKGGRRDNFYFCLLEYFEDKDRWFLRSLLQVSDEETGDGDLALKTWIEKYDLKHLVVDFPLSPPAALTFDMGWMHDDDNMEKDLADVQQRIADLLEEDRRIHEDNPKQYERDRNSDDEIDYTSDILDKKTDEHLLSRSFKRRLKKGFIPYWNRTLDFWVWQNYYDQLLKTFNLSYDSFGNTSLMILFRFNFLREKFPEDLKLFESNTPIILLELLRKKIILKKDIANLADLEECVEARLDIIRKIEQTLKIFIYDRDLELLVKSPRAFESFLLAVSGQMHHRGYSFELPDWTKPEITNFLVPDFGAVDPESIIP